MTWRIATRHVSTYRYAGPVVASYNEARLTPSSDGRQLVLDAAITVTPAAHVFRYLDYWASVVHAFEVQEDHEELVVVATSLVETGLQRDAAGESQTTWELLAAPQVRDRYAELLAPTDYAPFDAELAAEARAATVGATPAEAVEQVATLLRSTMSYEPGSTEVSTSASEAWQQRSGVCQDFAHLTLSMLRQLGVPARYVSGYLHPLEEAPAGEPITGASHAWIEAWLGSFQPIDPTNGARVAERHVTVARGRDYADVPPLRGVYHGGELRELSVAVELTRVA
ncbi:MAG TPA: transglutaminase family protein [Acidimicrobiales bacterium]|nr:transglutaminase family protein [Acidimicrobiales bacterium]